MCAILNWPLFRLNLSGDISLDDVVGTTQVRTEASSGQAITEFAYGRMIQAMLHGGVLLLDEFSAASPHVLMALQEVLEPCTNPHEIWAAGKAHATYVCTANRGETIHASPRFRVVVCDNTNGQGDLSGRFAGTNVMNEATRSRFTQWHYKGFPPRAEWRRMLQRKSGVSREVASKIIEFAAKINEGSAALGAKVVTSEVVINPRDTLAIARLTAAYGDVGRALRVAKVNGMRPGTDDYQFLLDTVRNMFGSGK
jgi:cobaltochelatase CobS